jgi:translation initiation factor 6
VPLIGSLACATNRGIIVSPDATDKDLDYIEKIMKVPVEIGSVNRGSPYVGTGLLANDTGFVVGKETTGPELARIDEALGFI